jgi:hypothetical protein
MTKRNLNKDAFTTTTTEQLLCFNFFKKIAKIGNRSKKGQNRDRYNLACDVFRCRMSVLYFDSIQCDPKKP